MSEAGGERKDMCRESDQAESNYRNYIKTSANIDVQATLCLVIITHIQLLFIRR